MTKRLFVPLSLACATLIGAVLAVSAVAAPLDDVHSRGMAARQCHEDQACWNWAKMGNHKRGIVLNTPDGEPTRTAVVGVCQFNLHDLAGWIDWQHTPHLRGDKFARSLTDCPWRLRYPALSDAFPA